MNYDKIIERDKLHSESKIYELSPETYDLFSKAQDNLNIVTDFLSKKVKGKTIVDFGCGTGKFIPKLAPLSKSYIGMDISNNQLRLAKEKSKNYKNVTLIKNLVNKIPLESNTVDLVFASWVIGSIHNLELRKRIIKEMKRVVKENGSIYLIENDIGGDYKEIAEENYGEEKTKIKLKWLEENGFEKVDSSTTYFEFESLESAKKIFTSLFGEKVASKVKNKKISHNIVIYKNGK